MNTDTGRIYDPEEYEKLRRAAGPAEGEKVEAHFMQEMQSDIEDLRAGKIVPVSEHVANLVREGKASAEKKAKRKAASASRKKNRHGR